MRAFRFVTRSARGALLAVVVIAVTSARAQQVPDTAFKPPIAKPAYAAGKGPRVVIDGGHHNFHTVDGRYAPFANLLRRDGYRLSVPAQRHALALEHAGDREAMSAPCV